MDIQALREQIDQCDDILAKTFVKRMETALEIAKYKKANGLPIADPARERKVISHVTEGCDEAMAVNVKLLYNTLFDLSRTYQQRYMTVETELTNHIQFAIEHTPKVFPKQALVACQGMEGAYSQQACDKLFALPNIMYCKRFEGVFQAIQSGLCAYGVLPIENSSYGSVTECTILSQYKFLSCAACG